MATPTTTTAVSSTVASSASPSCTTAAPGKYGEVPVTACNSNYNAIPAFDPAVAVAAIFGILTITHLVEAIIFKKRYPWVLIMGGAWETTAFALHALGARDQQNVAYATVYQILFLLAPLWINAFVYMTFGRMVYFFLPEKRVASVVKATSMSKYFVTADFLSFLVQATGGLMATPTASASVIATGLHLYEAGIGLQELFIVCFIGLMVAFHRRSLQLDQGVGLPPVEVNMGAVEDGEGMGKTATYPKKGWKPLLYALYAVLAFISLRIIYRLIEYSRGLDPTTNPVPFHEAYAYALDAFPMMVALLILAVVHPGRVLRGPDASLPRKTRAQKKAEKAAKKAEKEAKKEQKRMAKERKKNGGLPVAGGSEDDHLELAQRGGGPPPPPTVMVEEVGQRQPSSSVWQPAHLRTAEFPAAAAAAVAADGYYEEVEPLTTHAQSGGAVSPHHSGEYGYYTDFQTRSVSPYDS